jgi:F0F1-type ATP synthase membrane subunit b/b'
LTPPQLKRLREISLQQAGLIALLDQQVATRIGVTPAQLKSMRAQVSASNKQIQAIEKKASFPVFEQYKDKHVKTKQEAEAMRKEFQGKMAAAAATVRPQIAALVSDERTKLLGSLNQPEINKYKALMGKPFAEKH